MFHSTIGWTVIEKRRRVGGLNGGGFADQAVGSKKRKVEVTKEEKKAVRAAKAKDEAARAWTLYREAAAPDFRLLACFPGENQLDT